MEKYKERSFNIYNKTIVVHVDTYWNKNKRFKLASIIDSYIKHINLE